MSTINLLPKDYLQRAWQSRANMLCVVLFGVVMAGVGTAALVSEQSMRNTRQIRDKVDASYAAAAKLLTQMQQMQNTKRQMVNKARTATSLLERVPRSYLLAVVAQALPDNCALVKVELKPAPVKRTASGESKGSKFDAVKKKQMAGSDQPIAPTMELAVTGLAATDVQVANFIKHLQESPLLTKVGLTFTQNTTLKGMKKDDPDSQAREFRMTMELRPNVDVIDLIDSGAKGETAQTEPSDPAEGAKS